MLTLTSLDQAGVESSANPDRPVAATAVAFKKSRRPDKCLSAVMTILEVDLKQAPGPTRSVHAKTRKNGDRVYAQSAREATGPWNFGLELEVWGFRTRTRHPRAPNARTGPNRRCGHPNPSRARSPGPSGCGDRAWLPCARAGRRSRAAAGG